MGFGIKTVGGGNVMLDVAPTALDTVVTIDNVTGIPIYGDSVTGALILPSGTTAQRTAAPAVGAIRQNLTLGINEIWNGFNWGDISGKLPSTYRAQKSLRLRGSANAYLRRTFGTPTNNTVWTLSLWIKRGILGTNQEIITAGTTSILFRAASNDSVSFTKLGGNVANSSASRRDPSGWANLVVSSNGTNVTAYWNGTFDFAYAGTLPELNSAVAHNFGNYGVGTEQLDAYLAHLYFVDGQALGPDSFGEVDVISGSWIPKAYTGTYGNNGGYWPFDAPNNASYAGSFNGSNQFVILPTSSVFAFGTGNFTAECWFYTNASSTFQSLIDFWPNTSGSYIVGQWQLGTDNANHLAWYVATTGISSGNIVVTSSSTFALNSWNHAAIVRNGTTVSLYLNGVNVGSTTFSGTVGYSSAGGSLGRQSSGSSWLSGYLSNSRITNTAVYTSNFAPSSTPLTAITGTQLLTLQGPTLVDNSSNALTLTNNGVGLATAYPFFANIAADQSGNGNNWIPNNISLTAGTTYDSMTDVPTLTSASAANYCVLNPLDNSSNGVQVVLSNANLDLSLGSGQGRATFSVSSGKWYWEITSGATNQGMYGIIKQSVPIGSATFSSADGYYYWAQNGSKYNNGTGTAYGSGLVGGDVLGIAFDADAGTLAYYKNGVSIGTAFTGLSGTFSPAFCQGNTSATATFNFGQRPFSYTPPSGFVALNTFNLP